MEFDDVENLSEEQILAMYKDVIYNEFMLADIGPGHYGPGSHTECREWSACYKGLQYRYCADFGPNGRLIGYYQDGRNCK